MKNKKILSKSVLVYRKLENENIGLRSQILGILVTSKPEQEKINDFLLAIRSFENTTIQPIEKRIDYLQSKGGFSI